MQKILFIEDESALQSAIAEALGEKEGYQIVQAMDGEMGLRLAKEEKPDLILLDLILPKKDGFWVLEELRQNPATKDLPVVVLSNLDSTEDIERVMSLGAKMYLVKTEYQLSEIARKIKDVLNK